MPFTDNFTGTSGDNLESRTGWTRVDGVAGGAQINASNQLKFTTGTDTAYRAPDAGSADHYAQCVCRGTWRDFFPLCVRITDKDNFIGLQVSGGGGAVQIFKRVAGTYTLLGNVLEDAASGSTYKLDASGDSIEGFKDGVSYLGPFTESAFNTVTYPGMQMRVAGADPVMDDWESTQAAGGGGATGYLNLPLMGVG